MPHGLDPDCLCIRCMCVDCLAKEVDGTAENSGYRIDADGTAEWVCNRDCPCKKCHGEEDWWGEEIEAEPED